MKKVAVIMGSDSDLPIVEKGIAVLKEYGIRRCYYGHVHGSYDVVGDFEAEGIRFSVTSADFLHFTPKIIYKSDIL